MTPRRELVATEGVNPTWPEKEGDTAQGESQGPRSEMVPARAFKDVYVLLESKGHPKLLKP